MHFVSDEDSEDEKEPIENVQLNALSACAAYFKHVVEVNSKTEPERFVQDLQQASWAAPTADSGSATVGGTGAGKDGWKREWRKTEGIGDTQSEGGLTLSHSSHVQT